MATFQTIRSTRSRSREAVEQMRSPLRRIRRLTAAAIAAIDMLAHFMVSWVGFPRREILKYNVAPRLGVRAVERRLRQRLPKLAGSIDTSMPAPL